MSQPGKKQVYTCYIVDVARSAGGKKGGLLKNVHPVQLGADVLDGLLKRNDFDKSLIDHVIYGSVAQIGPQSCNVARNIVLASSQVPVQVPATTVDRQCGSSLQATFLAAQAVMSGVHDIVIAGGVESMTQVPMGSNLVLAMKAGLAGPNVDAIHEKFPTPDGSEPPTFSQFLGAELVAKEFNVTREEADKYSVESHQLAALATKNGYTEKEIIPIVGTDKDGNEVLVKHDEGIRSNITLEGLQKLKVLMPKSKQIPNPVCTAGSASQITDGSSCVLLMNEEGLRKTGLKPRARIIALAQASDDPVVMLRAPIFSTQKVLDKYNLKISDIDFFEANEAFASVALMIMKHFKIDRKKMNPHGGAIANGHPLGASGVKLIATAVNALETHKKSKALVTLCEGGGQASSIVIERCDAANAKL